MTKNTTHPFNNKIETGLRVLTILNAFHPCSLDLQTLVYFDYLTVHTGDIKDGLPSLHPPVPSRKGEMFIRRSLILESLDMLINKGLIEKYYATKGIEYQASEDSMPFLETLGEDYSLELNKRANWVCEKFKEFNLTELQGYMKNYMSFTDRSFNINLINNE